MHNKPHTKKAREKMSERMKEQYRTGERKPYWLGKKRPEMKNWIDLEHLKPYRFKKGQGQTNTGRTHFKKGHKPVSPFQKGHIPYFKGKKNTAISGKNHWNWQDGKSLEEYGKDWTAGLKKKVKERDRFKCKKCGTENNLVVHHKDFNKKNNKISNLEVLCRSCHTKLHTFQSV